MKLKKICDIAAKGQRVLIRCDLNCPMNDDGQITDDMRIKAALPTIQFILAQGGKVVLMSHLGRPDGQVIDTFSLLPIANRLAELLNCDVAFAPDCIGEATERLTKRLKNGGIVLLENLRFHKEESQPEKYPDFAKALAKNGDIFVNDAFATAHRKHASNYDIVSYFDEAVCGFLIEKEVLILSNLLTQAQPPFYAIIGGSKISTKIGVLDALFPRIDGLFIGGGMVFTFMKALGYKIGNSLLDESHVDTAKHLMKKMKSKGIELFLPKDIIIANSLSKDADIKVVFLEEGIEDGYIGVDIGPETCSQWRKDLEDAGTIFWNGPLGIFEIEAFSTGTKEITQILADSPAMTIVGGGDSAAAVYQSKLNQKFTFISTGGGATLEFIEFGTLSALETLLH